MDITLLSSLFASASGIAPVYVEDVFSTNIFNGTTNQTVTNDIDLAGEGGLVWLKRRVTANAHFMYDTERGVDHYLRPDSTGISVNSPGIFSSFNSDGYTIGNNTNVAGSRSCGWTWRKQPGFFDIVTYTGTSSVQTISHNLGSTPGMIMVKSTASSSTNWTVYHRSSGAEILHLEPDHFCSGKLHNLERYRTNFD